MAPTSNPTDMSGENRVRAEGPADGEGTFRGAVTHPRLAPRRNVNQETGIEHESSPCGKS